MIQILLILTFSPIEPNPDELRALGRNIGNNSFMRKINACMDYLDEDEEDTEDLEAF